ncbi:hypothetical protein LCGC14_0232410 [marine sediment metagenome]|uniref:Uncharacterized protein n=1 Tax=marine sediment metagenome TaxID=412755 RepID=A0A0F9UAA4_9ZZZZ
MTSKQTAKTTATTSPTAVWNQLKKWPGKTAGPAPSNALLVKSVALGYRAGAANALAVAMYMRPAGATQNQIAAVCGGPQLNVFRTMVATGAAKIGTRVKAAKETRNIDGKSHTVYKVAVTGGTPKPKKQAATKKQPAKKAPARKRAARKSEAAKVVEALESGSVPAS